MARRILLLDTGKEWGGGTNSLFELLKRIDRRRFAIDALFYRNYPKGKDADLRAELAALGVSLDLLPPRAQPLWAKLAKELVRGLLRPFPAARARALFAIERRWRIDPAAAGIAERLRRGGFDLLYMNNQPSSNLEGYLAAELAGVPVVQHCRSNARLIPEEADIVNRVARRLLCVSAGVRDRLVEQGVRADLCAIVHNAIDVRQALPAPVALPGVAPGTVTLGAIGSLLPRKACDHILRALARLAEGGRCPAHLVLVGDGPERARLERMTTELGLGQSVSFAGFRNDPLSWIAALDIVVLASDNEGFPRVILEAMLLGKPVIGSDVIGTRELVAHGETGFLYPFGDIDRLAGHLHTLLADPALRQRLGETGRKRVVERHSIEAYVSAVERHLDEATASPFPPS